MGSIIPDDIAKELNETDTTKLPLIYETTERTIRYLNKFSVQTKAGILQFRCTWLRHNYNRAMFEQAGAALSLCNTDEEVVWNINHYRYYLRPCLRGNLYAQR